jgi:ankyrin repeat protein
MRLLVVPIAIGLILALPSSRLGDWFANDRGLGALESNDPRRLEEQLRGGMDVNAAGVGGLTPLMAAAQLGRADMARLLIRRGARITARSGCGQTALAYAASSGDADTIVLLLQSGADPNVTDAFGNTPLIWASQCGDADKVRALLAAGADPARSNRSGWTATKAARAFGYPDIVMLLSR